MYRIIAATSDEILPDILADKKYIFNVDVSNRTYSDDVLFLAEQLGMIKLRCQSINPKTGKLFQGNYNFYATKDKKSYQDLQTEVKEANIPNVEIWNLRDVDWSEFYNISIDDYDKGFYKLDYHNTYKNRKMREKYKSITGSDSIIEASSSFDSVKFGGKLFDCIKQFMPKNCQPRLSPQYDVITIYNCPSRERLLDAVKKAADIMNLDLYDTGDIIAVIDGESCINITVDYYSDDHEGNVFIDYNKYNGILEDWWNDYESQINK